MSAFRKYPLLATALTVCAVVVVGEGWCIYERFAASRTTAKKLADKRAQLAQMATLAPAPTRDVAKAIEADLARAQAALGAMQSELKGRGPAAERMAKAKVPAARTDAYFDLATFVEKTRELARKNEVDVRPEAARFGFAAHANEAAEAERIEPVFRQRQVAQYLVESLIEAHPRALLSVKREPPLTKKEREDQDAAALAAAAAVASGTPPEATAEIPLPEGPDFFAIDPRVSVRAPGFLHTTGFRLAFIGETGSLRALLNKLATFELPVLVREVEVEPATAEEAAVMSEEPVPADNTPPPASVVLTASPSAASTKAASPRITSTAAPIVTKPFSRFTVTVEYIELVAPKAADDPAKVSRTDSPSASDKREGSS
jgi:hypothetical protein